jgi:pilus assembly protein Flp/PilA
MPLLREFAKDECGATAIEYALIAVGVAVVIVAAVQGLGSKLNAAYQGVQTAL